MRVVDASVAAKWFLIEPDTEAALGLLSGGDTIVAPSILRTEVAGAILRRHRQDAMDEPKARVALNAWSSMLANGLVSLVPDADVLERAVNIAVKTRHPLHDCLYLAVAASMETELVTADTRLYDRGAKVARVVLLGHKRSGRA